MVSPDETLSRAGTLTLIGGELALDFANTCSGRGWPTLQDHLRSAEHVALWAAHARVLGPEDGHWLAEAVAADEVLGARLLAEALALREDVYQLGVALSAGRTAPPETVENLSRAHARAL